MALNNRISVAIFSFNRGEYLKNCFESVARCMNGADIKVYDDGSDDSETLRYLDSLGGTRVRVSQNDGALRHGGLYHNMQVAYEECDSEYLLFLQDDTQLVRVVDECDMAVIDAFFEKNKSAAFINPVFLKGHRRASINKQLMWLPDSDGYYQVISESMKRRSVSMYYCDVVIAKVDRLREKGWCFSNSETLNAERAREHFSKMLQMASPFIMHVPEVTLYRKKMKTYGARLADKIVGEGVKNFLFMSEGQVDLLRRRDKQGAYPYAEDFIQTESSGVQKPFQYSAVNVRLYTRVLHKLEYKLRGLFVGTVTR